MLNTHLSPTMRDVPITAELNSRKMKVISAGLTDVGKKRTRNEDSFLIDDDLQLYIVADGMGGHAGGGTASRIAVETLHRELQVAHRMPHGPFSSSTTLQQSPLPEIIRGAVEKAGSTIFQAAQQDARLHGMGTTVISLLVYGEHALFAHVGDSRAYLIRGELVQQLSEDHSWVNEQLKAGIITADEAKNYPYKNVITRSVGVEAEVQVDVMGIVTLPKDIFLLCSDGLANMVEDRELLDILRNNPLEKAPRLLVDLANARGGEDNITVIVAQTEKA